MEQSQAEQRVRELREQLEYHSKKYYDEDEPEITDYEYDMLLRELRELEERYPVLRSSQSLTERVGTDAPSSFAPKFTTRCSDGELAGRVFRSTSCANTTAGCARRTTRQSTAWSRKSTVFRSRWNFGRGNSSAAPPGENGQVGEDVTANLRTIRSIPKRIAGAPAYLEVRGEVYMSKTNFMKLVDYQETQ